MDVEDRGRERNHEAHAPVGGETGPRRDGSATFPFARPRNDGEGQSDESAAYVDASPEAEAAALRALREELANVPHGEKDALAHVQRVAPELVDDDHMLGFLEGENYDVHLARKRLVRHWSQRYKIFGPDKFALPMTLDGAMAGHVEKIKLGYMTLLPVCDGAGRSIIYINKSAGMPSTEEKLRILWYLLHVITMRSPGARKSGYVVLADASGGRVGDFDPRFSSQAASYCDRSFPVRWTRIHVCHVNAVFPLVAQVIKAVLTEEQRQSFLLHNGSDGRVLETLAEYGLPARCVPTRLGGTLHVSADDFVRDRLVAEGGLFECEESIAISLSPGQDGDSGSNPDMGDEAWRGFIHGSNNAETTGAGTHEPSPPERTYRNHVGSEGNSIRAQKKMHAARGKHGRRGDPRMNLAVQAKVDDPELTLVDALTAGGFVFPDLHTPGVSASVVRDTDGISLPQRRNQLMRRLRYMKGKGGKA